MTGGKENETTNALFSISEVFDSKACCPCLLKQSVLFLLQIEHFKEFKLYSDVKNKVFLIR